MNRCRSCGQRSARRRPARRQSRTPSFVWGRALMISVALMIVWAQWKGQA